MNESTTVSASLGELLENGRAALTARSGADAGREARTQLAELCRRSGALERVSARAAAELSRAREALGCVPEGPMREVLTEAAEILVDVTSAV